MAYGDFKDLQRRIVPDKVLCNKVSVIASDSHYDRYQRGLTSMVYKFFYKRLERQGQEFLRIKNWQMYYINLSLENSKA